MPLKKATLLQIESNAGAKPLGDEIEVQFNPASLKLELANKVEGGDSKGRQSRQYLGKTSTTLSFDLHFDTADEGTSDQPVSVRTRTALVEAFVLPIGSGNTKQAPPKARFHWDELVIDGIIESLSIDFDLFAPNGTPLRAKMAVSMKEQDAKYELLQTGPGANQAIEASPPGSPGTGPGTASGGPSDRTADALAGESAADFAARMGLDPSAWRGIAVGLGAGSSLSLSAGVSIDFSSSLSAGAGIGFSAGVEASAGVSLGASFGLGASASASSGVSLAAGASLSASVSASAELSAGFALAAAGGVGAAIETVAIVQAQGAASDARRSFGSAVPALPPAPPSVTSSTGATAIGTASIPRASVAAVTAVPGVPPPSATPRPAMPDQSRPPLQTSGAAGQRLPSASAQAAAPAAPAPPMADPRATSFGFGVPLRPRVGSAADLRSSTAAGRVPLRTRSSAADLLTGTDPSVPPWAQLPAGGARRAADRWQSQRHPARPCGCSGSCHHGGSTCR
jgi:hypothetical protein